MALLYADSFDTYATADLAKRWTVVEGSITTAAKRNGTHGWSCGNSQGISKTLAPGTSDSGVMGAAMYWYSNIGADIKVGNTAGLQFYVRRHTTDSTLGIYRGDGTHLNTSTNGYGTGTWWYVEVKWTIANSGGTIEVRVNGVAAVTYTGDTSAQTAQTWTYVSLVGFSNVQVYVDDVYICDQSGGVNDDFLGDVTVEALLPQTDAVAPGSNASWTCGTGSDHGALVDENPPYTADDTNDYVYTATLNAYDTWEYPSLTAATATIYAVQVATCAKKTDTGAATYVNVARPASTNRDGGVTHSPSDTSYNYGIQVWDANPEDSQPWEVADVNGCEFGVKRTG